MAKAYQKTYTLVKGKNKMDNSKAHQYVMEKVTKKDKEKWVFNLFFDNIFMTWILGGIVFILSIWFGFSDLNDVKKLSSAVKDFLNKDFILVVKYGIKTVLIFTGTVLIIGFLKYIIMIHKNIIVLFDSVKDDYKEVVSEMSLFTRNVENRLKVMNDIVTLQEKEVKNVNKEVRREMFSLQHGATKHLKSDILSGLLGQNMPLSKFLVEQLDLEVTDDLTDEILKSFDEAKKEKLSKACCVINNTKFIEVEKKDFKSIDNTKMFRYFSNHIDYTDENLIVSRVFSFKHEIINDTMVLSVNNDEYRYILYLYLVSNYYSGVNTYLHLYSCDLNRQGRCTENDYVSLMTIKEDSLYYKAFFSPSETSMDDDSNNKKKIDALITIENDIMLAKVLEEDYKYKVKETPNLAYKKKAVSPVEGHLKIKPDNMDLIHRHLGISGNKEGIKKKLEEYAEAMVDDLCENHEKAISHFFACELLECK